MVRNEAEYREAVGRRDADQRRLAEHRAQLKAAGLSDDEVKRVTDPLVSFHLQLSEEVERYERLKTRAAKRGRKITVTPDECMKNFTPEERARVEARAAELIEEELTLRDLRQAQYQPDAERYRQFVDEARSGTPVPADIVDHATQGRTLLSQDMREIARNPPAAPPGWAARMRKLAEHEGEQWPEEADDDTDKTSGRDGTGA